MVRGLKRVATLLFLHIPVFRANVGDMGDAWLHWCYRCGLAISCISLDIVGARLWMILLLHMYLGTGQTRKERKFSVMDNAASSRGFMNDSMKKKGERSYWREGSKISVRSPYL